MKTRTGCVMDSSPTHPGHWKEPLIKRCMLRPRGRAPFNEYGLDKNGALLRGTMLCSFRGIPWKQRKKER